MEGSIKKSNMKAPQNKFVPDEVQQLDPHSSTPYALTKCIHPKADHSITDRNMTVHTPNHINVPTPSKNKLITFCIDGVPPRFSRNLS